MNQEGDELLAQADAARDKGDHRRSAELANQAAQLAERAQDHALAALALARVALSEVRLGDLVGATANAHRAIAHCAGQPADAGLSRIHSTLSLAYERAGLHRFAVSHALRARDIARECQDAVAECWALVRLGTADDGPEGAGHGLEHLALAVTQARELGDPVLLFAALNNTTRRWVVESDRAAQRGENPGAMLLKAMALADEAAQLPTLAASAFMAATSMANLSGIHRRLGQADKAKVHLSSALDIAQHHNYQGLVTTLQLERTLLAHAEQPSAQNRLAIQQLLDADPMGTGADPDLLLEARRILMHGYRDSGDLAAALAQMERLHEALLSVQVRRIDLQSRLLFNQAELDQARHAMEVARFESQLQRVRADAEHQVATQLAQARDQLEQEVVLRTADLHRAKAAAESASRAKSSFLAAVSHELHTPLNGLIGMVELAARRAVEPRQIDQLRKAVASAWQLNALFDNILDFVATDADAPPLAQATDLRALLAGVQAKRLPAAQAKGLALIVDDPVGLPESLHLDGTRVARILDTLLDNAVKFSPQGPIRITAHGEATGTGRQRLRLAVVDRGPGLPPDTVARLFQPFQMGDESATRHHRGLGLGLALAQRLADSLGGELGFTPTPGGGSTFHLVLALDGA